MLQDEAERETKAVCFCTSCVPGLTVPVLMGQWDSASQNLCFNLTVLTLPVLGCCPEWQT